VCVLHVGYLEFCIIGRKSSKKSKSAKTYWVCHWLPGALSPDAAIMDVQILGRNEMPTFFEAKEDAMALAVERLLGYMQMEFDPDVEAIAKLVAEAKKAKNVQDKFELLNGFSFEMSYDLCCCPTVEIVEAELCCASA
jgi:hypothetical protein